MKAVVLVSGGLDSTVLLHAVVKEWGAENVHALNLDYGQRHAIELAYAVHNTREVKVPLTCMRLDQVFSHFKGSALLDPKIAVPNIKDVLGHPQPVTYVPFRNTIFLSIALGFAESHGASAVYYGAQLHDEYGYYDTTQEFIDRINSIALLNRLNQIKIIAPLAKNKKADNIRLGLELAVDFSKCWSCYDPKKRAGNNYACGTCPTCSERLKGFKEVGQEDPLPYVKG